MSEGIIIALITAIGSLVGGIVSNLITASATIKAATFKEKANPPTNQPRSWGVIIGGALVGAIATLIVLSLLGMFPPTTTNTPEAIQPNTNAVNTPMVITSDTRVLAKLVIPATNNQGVTYNITESGLYTFAYSDSAVSLWMPWSTKGTWSTSVECFKGDNVVWNSTSLSDSPVLFRIGNFNIYESKDEAIQASKGEKATLNLDAGDQITCVLSDSKNDYLDNAGDVIIEVSVSQ